MQDTRNVNGMRKFYIRADGNEQIGMGHVMRCLTIADAMKRYQVNPVFLTASKECVEVITQRGFLVELLESDYRDMLSELPLLENKVSQHTWKEKPVILVDSYQVTEEYYQRLGKLFKVACMEDMGISYPVELLINYNIYAPRLSYDREKIGKCCLGALYTPLREEFQTDAQYKVKDKVTDVMITTGGSDPLCAAKAFADAILAMPQFIQSGIKLHIISGPFNPFVNLLKDTYADCSQVIIYEKVKNMKEIMKQCDVVLTAAGSTVYEVSALGVPMIVFYYAENQRQGAEILPEITGVFNLGDFAHEKEETIENVKGALLRHMEDLEYRRFLHKQEKDVVDAKGADRLAREVIGLVDAT